MSFWALFVLFLSSLTLTGLVRTYTLKAKIIDIPNHRSSHSLPTPRGGGLAIILSFLGGTMILFLLGIVRENHVWAVCLPGGLVAVIGFIDDNIQLSAKIRFMSHVISVVLALYLIKKLPSLQFLNINLVLNCWWGYVLVAFVLIWFLNLFNFMDGIDGIASVETICVAGGAASIMWLNKDASSNAPWLICLCVATLGFLVWNWPPAKIFMGDGCSGFLGLLLGIFALITSEKASINIWSWLILYAVFIVDATVTLICRIIRGAPFYLAHRSHAYQILSRRWGSHLKVTLAVLGINIFWLFPLAFIAARYNEYAFVAVLVALTPLVWCAVKIGSGTGNI